MLNVAFTRPRDEVHIFHSADIDDFGMADGKGAIKDWLNHCAAVKEKRQPEDCSLQAQLAKADSGFEQQVMTALAAVEERNLKVRAQYPCCDYFIDIVASTANNRLAIECDGEWIHLDEHGELRIEDIDRQEVLERAGWRVIRIPYRSWRENSVYQVSRILTALEELEIQDSDFDSSLPLEALAPASPGFVVPKLKIAVNAAELAVIEALQAGASGKEEVFRLAQARLGFGKLGSKIRASLDEAATSLATRAVIRIEEDEMFFSNGEMRTSGFEVSAPPARKIHRRSRYSYRR